MIDIVDGLFSLAATFTGAFLGCQLGKSFYEANSYRRFSKKIISGFDKADNSATKLKNHEPRSNVNGQRQNEDDNSGSMKGAIESKKEITYEEWFKHNNNDVNWSFMTLYRFFKNDSEALDLLDVLLRKLNAQNIHPELWSVQQKDGKFFPLIKWVRGQNK